MTPFDRRLDILFTGNPAELAGRWTMYEAYLEAGTGLLITSDYAASGLPQEISGPGAFVRRFDASLLYFYSDRPVPALPADPLHVMLGNLLSVLLPLLVAAAPGRIFLFGADGGAPRGESEAYFAKTGGVAEASARTIAEVHHRLANEAWECDQNVGLSMRAIAELHGLPLPEVYNCCPDSNHRLFPRIDFERGLAMLEAGRS